MADPTPRSFTVTSSPTTSAAGGAAAAAGAPAALDRRAELDQPMIWLRGGRWHRFAGYSPLQLARRRNPGLAQWMARTLRGLPGQLCAEALAITLGVPE